MKLIPLSEQTRATTGFTHKAIIEYTDLTTAAGAADTTATIAIYPENTPGTTTNTKSAFAVRKCAITLPTAFDASDAAINSLLIEVGDGGDTDRFLDQTELAADGTYITYKHSKVTTAPHAYTSADTVDAKFTVAGGASPLIDELTSGKVNVLLDIVDLAQFDSHPA